MSEGPPPESVTPLTSQEADDLTWAANEGGGDYDSPEVAGIGDDIADAVGEAAIALMKIIAAYIRTLRG